MKKAFLIFSLACSLLVMLSYSNATATIYSGAMDNRAGLPYVPGFTGHSRAWVNGGDVDAGLRLEWLVENETTPGFWTYSYRVVRNTSKNKGFGFFDIETAADFTAANISSRQVISATDSLGNPISSGLASITISDPVTFDAVHDFSNAAVTEINPLTVLSKSDLSQYSGDPGRVPAGQPGGPASATPSAGPVPHPFKGIRVTFPGSFATLTGLGYEASEWEFRVVSNRVPMWGHVFGWGDQTNLSPFWYSDIYSNHIDDPVRLTLAPVNSLTGADPFQGWVLVPGPLPSVISTLPVTNSAAVPVTEPVTAVFSGVMNPATINAATFTLSEGGGTVDGTVSYNPATNTATFTPVAPLAPNTTYTATITNSAIDLAGNVLPTTSWSFTTVALDITPPSVTNMIPGNGATFIALGTSVTASFSEEVNPATITPATFTLTSASGVVSGAVTFNPAIRAATFTPNVPLSNNTLYTATITTGVTDMAGNALSAPLSWDFTTIRVETVFPIVVATVPASRAVNVQVNSSIAAIFSEPMDTATINGATLKVSSAGVPVAGTVTYDPATNTAIFTPGVNLAFSTQYSVTLTTNVSDPAGNHLPLVKSWNFTTAAPDVTPPTVTGTLPAGGSTNVSPSIVITAAFSEQIDPLTVGSASILLTGQRFTTTAPFTVTGTVSLSSGGVSQPSIIFTPDAQLPSGSTYTARISGVKDPAGNVMADKIWSFTTTPDGILFPTPVITLADPLKALQITVKLIQPSQDDLNHGDVAPLGSNGKPQPDGVIDIRDVLLLMRMLVGLIVI